MARSIGTALRLFVAAFLVGRCFATGQTHTTLHSFGNSQGNPQARPLEGSDGKVLRDDV